MNGRRNGTQKQGLRRRGCNEIDSRPDAIATLCDEIQHNDTERTRVFLSLACIPSAIPQKRDLSLYFFFFFISKDPGWREPPQPISLIRRFPIYARYESTRGQAEESLDYDRNCGSDSLPGPYWLINRVLDYALAL